MTKPKRWGGPQQSTSLFDDHPALRAMESEYEDTIIQAASTLGYRVHVERKARTKDGFRTPIKGHPGWPDIVIVGYGRAWFIELKRKPNKPTDDQYAWLEALLQAGVSAFVAYVPEQLQAIIDDLTTWRDQALNPRKDIPL